MHPEEEYDEPIDERLKLAWQELNVPDPTPERGDAKTEATTAWMRSVWNEIEAPEVAVPARLRFRSVVRRHEAFFPLAAAAVLLLVFGASFALEWERGPREGLHVAVSEAPLEEGATTGVAEIAQASPAQVAESSPSSTSPAEAPTEATEPIEEDAFILEHGSVRLLLLTPIHTSDRESDPETRHED